MSDLRITTCSTCNAEIAFIKSKATGRAIPVNADKRISVVTLGGETVVGYVSHFATCPDSDQHRRRG